MSRRRFLILTYPIASEDLPRLLGRITLDYQNPLDNSCPEDPSSITRSYRQGVVAEEAAKIFAKAESKAKLEAALEPVIKASASHDTNSETSLESSYIRTHRLKNHYKAFEKMVDEHGEEIENLLNTVAPRFTVLPEKVYMVIGYKSIINAKKTTKTEQSETAHTEGSAPIGAAANAAVPGSVPPDATLKASADLATNTELRTESVILGETGFALEYRTFKRSKLLTLLAKKSIQGTYTMGGVKVFPPAQAMGKPGDEDTDEDEDDGGNPLTLELDTRDAGKYELCRVGIDEFYLHNNAENSQSL